MDYVLLDTFEGMSQACAYFSKKKVVGYDLETTELEPWDGEIVLCQISDGVKTVLLDWQKIKAERKGLAPLKELLENSDIVKVSHNSKFEQKWLIYHADIFAQNVFDTFTASVILDYNEENDPYKSHGLGAVARRFLKLDLDKTEQKSDWGRLVLTEEQKEYAALDVYYLPKLYEVMQIAIEAAGLEKVAELEFDVIPVIAKTELRGHAVDRKVYEKEIVVLEELRKEASANLQSKLRPTTGIDLVQPRFFDFEEKNYGDVLLTSHSQVLTALSKLGVPVFAKDDFINIARYERSGKPFAVGTGNKALKPLIVDYPIVRTLSDFRGIDKQVTSFGTPMLDFFRADGLGNERIHPSFKTIGAPTGRMSCSKPNLQQIPAGSVHVEDKEYKLGFRKAFVPSKGFKLINCDYSQIELRIAAEFSKDPVFLEAFSSGKDLHALTASVIFDVPYELCIDDKHEYYHTYRSFSKRINFGIVYGIGSFGLAAQLLISQDEAQRYIDKHKSSHPVLWDYLGKQANSAIKTLSARTASGRVQWFREPEKDANGQYDRMQLSGIGRNGKNMPIQGCIGGDSRVLLLDKGYVKISDAPKGLQSVWDGEKFVNGIIADSGKKQKVEIEFKTGDTLVCSQEHKFQVVTSGIRKWVKASELKRNQGIEFTKNVPDFDGITNLEGFTSLELGTLCALHYLKSRDNVLYIPENEREIIDFLAPKLTKISKEDLRYQVTGNYITYELNTKTLELIQSLVTENGISEIAWSSKPFLKGFLKTYFNFDSCFVERIVVSASKQLARDIQRALQLFHVSSFIYDGFSIKKTNGSYVRISKVNLFTFAKNVGIWNEINLHRVLPDRKFKIYEVLATRILTNTIKSVTITDELVEMYDVVDSDSFKFTANGLITHNTSADILKRALKLLDTELEGLDAHVVNIVHDEISVEAEESIADIVKVKLEKAMREAGEEFLTVVPIKVDAKIINNWADK
jgi:DNA polymerase-1